MFFLRGFNYSECNLYSKVIKKNNFSDDTDLMSFIYLNVELPFLFQSLCLRS